MRKLKYRRRRRQQQRHYEKDFAFLKSWSKLFRFAWIFKSRWIFLQLDSWRNELKFRKRKRSYSCCFTSSIIIKRRLREFHVVVVRWRQKMNKKVCCTCKVVALLIKPFAFLTFSLPLPLSFPNLPNMVLRRRCHKIWTAVRETAGVLILFLFSMHTCHRFRLYVIILSNSKWSFLLFLVPQIS